MEFVSGVGSGVDSGSTSVTLEAGVGVDSGRASVPLEVGVGVDSGIVSVPSEVGAAVDSGLAPEPLEVGAGVDSGSSVVAVLDSGVVVLDSGVVVLSMPSSGSGIVTLLVGASVPVGVKVVLLSAGAAMAALAKLALLFSPLEEPKATKAIAKRARRTTQVSDLLRRVFSWT